MKTFLLGEKLKRVLVLIVAGSAEEGNQELLGFGVFVFTKRSKMKLF